MDQSVTIQPESGWYVSRMDLASDDRRSPRSKVLLSAVLEWPDRTLDVVLRDLSEHGALIELSAPVEVDSEVLFRRNDLRVRGHIAWVHDNFAGICFSRRLKPEVVLRTITRPVRRLPDEQLHRRPALTRPGMSPEEERWAEQLLKEPMRGRGRK